MSTPPHAARPEPSPGSDPRVAAFCSRAHPGLFYSVAQAADVWKRDPFDVESIHGNVRAAFLGMVDRATTPGHLPTGRMLLLLGDSGSGKTHLMRAFRNSVHAARRGYCAYMQMTAFTDQYGRYVLNNLIQSLDKPYADDGGKATGLMRLSAGLADAVAADEPSRVMLDRIRDDDLDQDALDGIIHELTDRIILDDRFSRIDDDAIRAILYLQHGDPRIKARVLKYLRCEDLTAHDRRLLGEIVPRTYPDAPHWMIQRLGEMIWALEQVPLILCVDQLEDMLNLDDAPLLFRRALSTLCDLVSRLPSCLVVISCLRDYYDQLKQHLAKPTQTRVQGSPGPIDLKAPREAGEIAQVVGSRLRFLYESEGVAWSPADPTFPFPAEFVAGLAGLSTRDVLEKCHHYRERCVAEGNLVPFEGAPVEPREPDPTEIEQAWNELTSGSPREVPSREATLAEILAGAIRGCSGELTTGHDFHAEVSDRFIPVEIHAPDDSVERLYAGVCNKSAKGGALGRQIEEVAKLASEQTAVLVRSTAFPSNPRAQITQQLGKLTDRGARLVVVEDSDWRTMMAYPEFAARHAGHPAFATWRTRSRPLSSLESLRRILDLDRIEGGAPAPVEARPREEAASKANGRAAGGAEASTELGGVAIVAGTRTPLLLGRTNSRREEPVTLDPDLLTRHAAFLGTPGSGKTTAALAVVEQLLLRGIPAILVDRKGDLCAYARPGMGLRDDLDDVLGERAGQLRARVEVALYTPRKASGRPLSIAAAPAGLGSLPDDERTQGAKYAAAALGGMMNYRSGKADQANLAILGQAIEILCQEDREGPVSIKDLIAFIADRDRALVDAVGRLDTRRFDKLAEDLQTLHLTQGDLLAAQGEPLDVDALLGRAPRATPGKTRLSIVSTKFLGNNQDIQFWVAQLLMELARWASRHPAPDGSLQAVAMFDEADLYLPAVGKPASKEPMENLIRRARSAGLGLFLATQNPGDFDYRCRENVQTWLVGQIREANSLTKMRPLFADNRVDIADVLPGQKTGEFHLVREGQSIPLRADRSAADTRQVPEDEIPLLARLTIGMD
ncbi:helicase HerA-like domain-containing protein [Aquisphaera giovannonii]|nr:helicase HerA-like domain-containing protein [Aquisphaera giovannonii]